MYIQFFILIYTPDVTMRSILTISSKKTKKMYIQIVYTFLVVT